MPPPALRTCGGSVLARYAMVLSVGLKRQDPYACDQQHGYSASAQSTSLATSGSAHSDAVGTWKGSNPQQKGIPKPGTKLDYTFWESADVLFSEKPKVHSVVGRWDWHIWQLIVALLPSLAVYQFVRIARADLAAADAAVAEAEDLAATGTTNGPQSERPAERPTETQPELASNLKFLSTSPTDVNAHSRQHSVKVDQMIERLNNLEVLLKSLQSDFSSQGTDKLAVSSVTATSTGPVASQEKPQLAKSES